MRLFRPRRLWPVPLALAALAGAATRSGPAEPTPAELVKRLGHDQFAERENAADALRKLGEKAIPAVRDGTASGDPEIRSRSQALLFAVLLAAGKSPATKMQLRPVRGRAFRMGSPENEGSRRLDENLHRARITKPFLIGTYEVTQGEYQQVMKRNPSWFARTGGARDKAPADSSAYPVEQVTWFDAVEFCNQLGKLDGHPPHYKLTEVKTNDAGQIVAAKVEVLGGPGYRLPTEAEWEYACRAGTETRFHYGRTSGGRSLNAKVFIESGGYGSSTETIFPNRTTAVGNYPRNAFGLYDMHGNVGEWCADWYEKGYYAAAPEDDPPGPKEGTQRVLRGGSWLVADTSCRSAARAAHPPGEGVYYTGFRVARTP